MLLVNDNSLTNLKLLHTCMYPPSLALTVVLAPEVAAHAELPRDGHVELEHAPAAPAL